jgi:hypothetical protein
MSLAPAQAHARLRCMTNDDTVRSGGCACGAVRFTVRGAPLRAGLCHCMTCRKAHAAAFNPFLVYRTAQVELSGDVRSWESSPGYDRRFCPTCGARVAGITAGEDEIELSLGSFDDIGWALPQYESWTIRREPWLLPLSVPQSERDRPAELRLSTPPVACASLTRR